MDSLIELGVYLVKIFAFVLALLWLVSGLMSKKEGEQNKLTVTRMNDLFKDLSYSIKEKILPKKLLKKDNKQLAKTEKQHKKAVEKGGATRKRVFVIDFNGDIKASACESLRHEISGLLSIANKDDEIVCRLESPGGMVHAYGLAASQLARIRTKKIPLTVCVDKVAASGGYLMAVMANKIVAAPYAIIGSIGVVAQFPNFNRFLKKHNVDYELVTAGEYKRTLSMLGPNTTKGRKKFIEELEAIHAQFKDTLSDYRPQLDIDTIATGEHWLAEKAHKLDLVDKITTSDDYLMTLAKNCDVYHVQYKQKKKLADKLVHGTHGVLNAIQQKLSEGQQRWWQ